MNFINRAFKNVTRKLSKTILLVIAFFAIGNFVIVGLGVANATDNAKTLTRQKMRAVASYSIDYEAVWQYADSLDEEAQEEFYKNYPTIKLENVEEIMKDERIKTASAISNTMAFMADGFDYVHLNNEAENNMNSSGIYYDENDVAHEEVYIEPCFFIKANFFDNMIELEDGEYTITSGRFYTKEEIDSHKPVCLISQALASVNGLSVGDTFTFYTSSPSDAQHYDGFLTAEDFVADFEIIGLFDTARKITPDYSQYDWTYPYENPENVILMPSTSLFSATLNSQQKMFDYLASQYPDEEWYSAENRPTEESILQQSLESVTFLLNDPLDVDGFINDYQDGLAQFMTLSADNGEFDKLSKPLDTLKLYANFIIWLVVINAIVIITLVTALTLKTREYEIGVLLSIGASKLKVVAQFFVELAIVAVIGFTLAIGTGSLVAGAVGEKVLDYQIQESDVGGEDDYYYDDDYINIWDTDYSTDISLDDLLEEYHVSISPIIIAEIYVLGLGIVLVSILIPSMMIMRFNPKRILMNQN